MDDDEELSNWGEHLGVVVVDEEDDDEDRRDRWPLLDESEYAAEEAMVRLSRLADTTTS